MAVNQLTFKKKERAKKKQQKKQEKFEKRLLKKESNDKGKGLEDMLAMSMTSAILPPSHPKRDHQVKFAKTRMSQRKHMTSFLMEKCRTTTSMDIMASFVITKRVRPFISMTDW